MSEPEFKTPAAVAAFLLKPEKAFVKLPGLLAFKVELPRADGERRTIAAFCRSGEDAEDFQIYCDGKLVARGWISVGHAVATKMVKNMAAALVSAKGHRVRNRLNRKARKAAAEAVTPIDPPLAVPPRPGLPEDDE